MSSELLISWVSTVVAVFTAIVLAIKAFRTTPGERADVAEKYEQMAERQAGQITKLKQQADAQDEIINTLKIQYERLQHEFREYKATTEQKFNEWQHGIALLIHQLESRGDQPIWKPKDTGELKTK